MLDRSVGLGQAWALSPEVPSGMSLGDGWLRWDDLDLLHVVSDLSEGEPVLILMM